MTSSTFSTMLFLLVLVLSLHMNKALGAQTKIRKLKEMIKITRNLEGNDYRSSKTGTQGSVSNKCHSKIITTYLPDDSSNPCIKCDSNKICYSCTRTRKCVSINRSPTRCTFYEKCCLIVPS